jgi:hypothetical protein
MRSIGGDFDVAPETFSGDDDPTARSAFPSCGRAALYHILMELRARGWNGRLLVPDYTCHTVPDAAAAAGVEVVPYSIALDLRPDRSALKPLLDRGDCCLLISDYFGLLPPDEDIRWVRSLSPGTLVIEDDAQAPFQLGRSLADYAFTSYRKAFASPDGADIRPRLPRVFDTRRVEPFVLAWSLAAVVKHAAQTSSVPDDAYLRLFGASAEEIDMRGNLDAAISPVGWNAMRSVAPDVAERRRANFLALSELLDPIGVRSIVELREDSVPLVLPILINDRDDVRRRLMEKRIYCPVHWPAPWAKGRDDSMSRELYDHELSLVVDQRYDIDDMRRVGRELEIAGVQAFVAV